jgi:type VI secretion system secreted protein Hcp
MPGNAFIKFDGVKPGESMQEGFKGTDGWIEMGDWDWEIEADSSFMKGGGASVGKPMPAAMNFSHYYDRSSPVILNRIVSGTHFATMEVAMCKQTGSGKPERYFTLKAKNVFITKVANKGGEDGAVNQDVSMVFKEVEIDYKPQKNDGSLDSEVKFGWNIAEMKITK